MRAVLDLLWGKHAVVLGLTLAGSLGVSQEHAVSVALGGAMQSINLWWLERSVRHWAGHASNRSASGVRFSRFFAGLRVVILLLAVSAAFAWLPVHALALTLGLSTVIPAVLWFGLTTSGSEA